MWEHPNIQNVFALLSTTFPKAGMKSEYRRRRGNVHIEHVGAVDDGGAYRLHAVYFVLTRSISLVQVIIGGEYGEWWDYRGWVEYCQGLPACAVVPKYITLQYITLHYIIARGPQLMLLYQNTPYTAYITLLPGAPNMCDCTKTPVYT